MTNQEVVRAIAIKAPVFTAQKRYLYIHEYCIAADDSGNTVNIAGAISEDNGVLKYVDIRDLNCAAPLPNELPAITWNGTSVAIAQAMQLMKDRTPVLYGKAPYKRIKAISLYRHTMSGNLFYRLVLLDMNGRDTVTIDPGSLSITSAAER